MLLKNIGSKIVNVGPVIMMPGDEKSFPKSAVDTPAIRTLCEFGFLSLEEEAEKAGKDDEKVKEETAEQPEAAPKKRVSRSKKASE